MSAHMARLAAMLAAKGRNGDTMIAHINPQEAAMLKAAGGSGTVNPQTGILEFMDADGQGTSEAGATGAGTGSYGSIGGGYGEMDYGGKDEGTRAREAAAAAAPGAGPFSGATYDTHGYGQMQLAGNRTGIPGLGFVGRMADKAIASPVATGLNMLASFTPIGALNTVSGFLDGPTIGGMATAAGRAMAGGFGGAPGAPGPAAPGQPGGGSDTRFALARALAGA